MSDFKNELEQEVEFINDLISRYLPDETGLDKKIREAMNYSVNAGGKRVRPMLMLEVYKLCGGDDCQVVYPFMAALECIHSYSLVHDDLPAMDNDDYRRGRLTTHKVFGEDFGILAGDGLLITNDISNSRTKALLKNVEVSGVSNLCVLNEDPSKISGKFHEFFDKVLIDAPCSGEGMFRKDNKLIRAWEQNGPKVYSAIQKSIILHGADMLRPGGMLLYSTCTFSKLEDEESIRYLLDNRPDMHLVDIVSYEGFAKGFISSDEDLKDNMDKCVRIFPHKMSGEGHFVALLKKDNPDDVLHAKYVHTPLKQKLPDELTDFLKNTTMNIDTNYINIRDSRVYSISKHMIDEKGLRIIRNGLLLGELKKNRFEPSQALAMALKKEQYNNCIDLKLSDERVIKYLKGETIDVDDFPDSKGWALVCVDGYPLGWGKSNGSQLKNKYLAGWRWM